MAAVDRGPSSPARVANHPSSGEIPFGAVVCGDGCRIVNVFFVILLVTAYWMLVRPMLG